jgi:hypothetical protein
MNKTRFYEILMAHKRGEDLTQLTPTNLAEAALIVDLTGGSDGSGGSNGGNTGSNNSENKALSLISLNNKDLPNLYYGQPINRESLLAIDFNKFVEAQESAGFSMDGSSDVYFIVLNLNYFDLSTNSVWQIYLKLHCSSYKCWFVSGSSTPETILTTYESGTKTWKEALQNLGVMKFNLASLIDSSNDNVLAKGGIVNIIPAPGAANTNVGYVKKFANLNETPIDYMWLE